MAVERRFTLSLKITGPGDYHLSRETALAIVWLSDYPRLSRSCILTRGCAWGDKATVNDDPIHGSFANAPLWPICVKQRVVALRIKPYCIWWRRGRKCGWKSVRYSRPYVVARRLLGQDCLDTFSIGESALEA